MTTAIAELWNGRLNPINKSGKNNPEIREIEEVMLRNLKKLEEIQDKAFAETLEKYNDCMDEYMTVITEQAFCDGFCLGTKLVVEALTGAENVV